MKWRAFSRMPQWVRLSDWLASTVAEARSVTRRGLALIEAVNGEERNHDLRGQGALWLLVDPTCRLQRRRTSRATPPARMRTVHDRQFGIEYRRQEVTLERWGHLYLAKRDEPPELHRHPSVWP